MAKKKQRTKTKKKSTGSQFTVVEETTEVTEVEGGVLVTQSVEAVTVEISEGDESAEAEAPESKTEAKASLAGEKAGKAKASETRQSGTGYSADEAREQIVQARESIQSGNNREARKILVELVDRGAPLEEREQAMGLLRQIELDVRTLLVGAVAMLTLVLIPTVGLVKALWALPLLFPILLPIVPGVAGMLTFWSIPFLLPLSTTWHVKFFVPVAGLILTLILLVVQRSSVPGQGSANAS